MATSESQWSATVTGRTEAPEVIPPIDTADIAQIVALGGTHINFEDGNDGDSVSSVYTAIGGATDGTISADYAAEGTKSFKTLIRPDEGGYGSYGGILGETSPKPPRMTHGGEIWIRWYSFKPSQWENECDPSMKHMRLETNTAEGVNAGGYLNLNLDGHQHKWLSEPDQGNTVESPWYSADVQYDLQKVVWECYEMYIRLGVSPTATGGKGRVIVWKDGIRMIETDNRATMKDVAGNSARILWKTFHQHNNGEGGGATEIRYSYLDQWTTAYRGITTSDEQLDCTSAMALDAQGHPMIGTAKL